MDGFSVCVCGVQLCTVSMMFAEGSGLDVGGCMVYGSLALPPL